jgi:hypothetical protein
MGARVCGRMGRRALAGVELMPSCTLVSAPKSQPSESTVRLCLRFALQTASLPCWLKLKPHIFRSQHALFSFGAGARAVRLPQLGRILTSLASTTELRVSTESSGDGTGAAK